MPDRDSPLAPPDHGSSTGTYANLVDVSASRGRVDLSFGVRQARQAGQEPLPVQLSGQFALTPSAAKRFLLALQKGLPSRNTNPRKTSSGAGAGASGAMSAEQAQPLSDGQGVAPILQLFREIGALDTRISLERSLKLIPQHLCADRLLFAVDRRDAVDQKIVRVCENIKMPGNLLASLQFALAEANHVYFGVEQTHGELILKAYLERRDKIETELRRAGNGAGPFQLFTGWKWNMARPAQQAVTHYWWYPHIDVDAMLQRICDTLGKGLGHGSIELVENLVRQTAAKASNRALQYLEVVEDDNPRTSFDLNLYKCGYRLTDLSALIATAMAHYDIPRHRYQRLYQSISAERVGHIAAGIDRHNRDFMTLYYGATYIQGRQLRNATIRPRNA